VKSGDEILADKKINLLGLDSPRILIEDRILEDEEKIIRPSVEFRALGVIVREGIFQVQIVEFIFAFQIIDFFLLGADDLYPRQMIFGGI
jgi:hypothetical protein